MKCVILRCMRDEAIAGELIHKGTLLTITQDGAQKVAHLAKIVGDRTPVNGVSGNYARKGKPVEVMGLSPYILQFIESHDFEREPELIVV
jgi:hypothetical protein